MAGPRIFVIDRRVVVASGRGADDATERFCHAAIRRLNANQPEEIAWECAASADRGHFAAIFRKTKDGEVVTRRYSHAQAEAATEAVRLGWAESQDPAAVAAYEARTLEGATGAKEITLPSPEGMLQTIGRIFSIGYQGTLQGTTGPWRHTFEDDSGPMLYADQEGRLYMAGGSYRVTDVGIEDGAPAGVPGGFELADFPPIDEPAPWEGGTTGQTEEEIFAERAEFSAYEEAPEEWPPGEEPGVPF